MPVSTKSLLAAAAAAVLLSDPAWSQRPPAKSDKGSEPPRNPAAQEFNFNPAEAARNADISVLIVPGDETTLSSQMAGKIKKINVGLGATVQQKTVLLEFDCAEQEAQLQTAQAEYRGSRETHLAKLKLQALGAAGELEVTVAAAAADKARSQVLFRESQMAYCKIDAPFAGRIARVRAKEAETVPVGQPLLDLVNAREVKAQLFVPAAWLSWIQPGTKFVIRAEADGRRYNARVSRLNARVEGVSQALEIEAEFEGSTQFLLPGMVGTAIFPNQRSNQAPSQRGR